MKWWEMIAVLGQVVREGLSDHMTVEQREQESQTYWIFIHHVY